MMKYTVFDNCYILSTNINAVLPNIYDWSRYTDSFMKRNREINKNTQCLVKSTNKHFQ